MEVVAALILGLVTVLAIVVPIAYALEAKKREARRRADAFAVECATYTLSTWRSHLRDGNWGFVGTSTIWKTIPQGKGRILLIEVLIGDGKHHLLALRKGNVVGMVPVSFEGRKFRVNLTRHRSFLNGISSTEACEAIRFFAMMTSWGDLQIDA